MDAFVTNVFWSDGYVNGGKIFILYTDYTYDIIRTKHHANAWNKEGKRFKQFANLKVLRINRYTKEQAINYIKEKDESFEDEV